MAAEDAYSDGFEASSSSEGGRSSGAEAQPEPEPEPEQLKRSSSAELAHLEQTPAPRMSATVDGGASFAGRALEMLGEISAIETTVAVPKEPEEDDGESFAAQLRAAGAEHLLEAAKEEPEESSEDDGTERLYQAKRRAVLREHAAVRANAPLHHLPRASTTLRHLLAQSLKRGWDAQLDSGRCGALMQGEVVSAEPPPEGGLRVHCPGRGWASATTSDGSPLLERCSRDLRRSLPEFGLCYSAKVRVPVRDSPAVSSATLDAVMAGECVRVERVVISEQGVPKIGIVLPTDGGGSGARWGWASYASVSDGSPLWSALKEAPPSPRRLWGGAHGEQPGPPLCRPPDTSEPTDEHGRRIFVQRGKTTVGRETFDLLAQGLSRHTEAVAAEAHARLLLERHEAAARALAETPLTTFASQAEEQEQEDEEVSGGSGRGWQPFGSLEDQARDRPDSVSLVRGHGTADDLSYIRSAYGATAAGKVAPAVLVAEETWSSQGLQLADESIGAGSYQLTGAHPSVVDPSLDQRSGSPTLEGTSGLPSAFWVPDAGQHEESAEHMLRRPVRCEVTALAPLRGDSRQGRWDPPVDSDTSREWIQAVAPAASAVEAGRGRERKERPPSPLESGGAGGSRGREGKARGKGRRRPPSPPHAQPPPPPPSERSWHMAEARMEDAVEDWLAPLATALPKLRRACLIARCDAAAPLLLLLLLLLPLLFVLLLVFPSAVCALQAAQV